MSTTFTHTTPGIYDAATDTWSAPEIAETVSGEATQTKGDPEQYRALSLVESEAPTLLWAPNTYGDAAPDPGWTVTWADVEYVVKAVDPVAPDGVVIVAKIVIGR